MTIPNVSVNVKRGDMESHKKGDMLSAEVTEVTRFAKLRGGTKINKEREATKVTDLTCITGK